jgi:hypothetical protein
VSPAAASAHLHLKILPKSLANFLFRQRPNQIIF